MSARLSALAELGIEGRLVGEDRELLGVRRDSREVEPGDLFVALPGADEEAHAADAVARGAVAIVADRAFELGVPVYVTAQSAEALPRIADAVYGGALTRLGSVGVTGTNGKTTCSRLLEAVFADAGEVPAVVGTGALRAPGLVRETPFTTPYGDELARFAREAEALGAQRLILEVSSHALELHRVDAIRFSVAAFTNLTQDHLDFHPTFEDYGEAKARLFVDFDPACSVINVDDAFGRVLAGRARGRVLRVSAKGAEAELSARSASFGREGIHAELDFEGARWALSSPLVGRHNLENLLVVLGVAIGAGVPMERALETLKTAPSAPGRLEKIEHPEDVSVYVDYAHTPDALVSVLSALRPITPGRLVVVFGCGGDRDRGKRPKMGRAAGEGADLVIATSDNPRSEQASAILEAVVEGLADRTRLRAAELLAVDEGFAVIEDRAEAIHRAIAVARPGDTVLIAGKGHETYQIIGAERRPFDDRVEARAAIAALGASWRP